MDKPRFSVHDTTITIWSETLNDWDLYGEIKATMKKLGFSWKIDPRVAKLYKSLKKYHHYGRLKELEFNAEIHPVIIKVEFYQNLNFENKAGGRYDFNKLGRMPYVTRLRFLKALARLRKLLIDRGFEDQSVPKFKKSSEFVAYRRSEIEAFHGRDFYSRGPQTYNATDADGVLLKDGDVRYYRDRSGYLARGRVYHSLNNMWWIIVNESHWDHAASFCLFSWKPGLKRKQYRRPMRRIQDLLAMAVESQDFERAIILRDLLSGKKRHRSLPVAGSKPK